MEPNYGARIRAARRFAGMSQTALAKALHHEVQWVKRREAGTQDAEADLPAIAHATKVPIGFLQHGWAAMRTEDDPPELDERVEALERRVATLTARLEATISEVGEALVRIVYEDLREAASDQLRYLRHHFGASEVAMRSAFYDPHAIRPAHPAPLSAPHADRSEVRAHER